MMCSIVGPMIRRTEIMRYLQIEKDASQVFGPDCRGPSISVAVESCI
jgi:hypothetical protein